jgi:preprotein translocase subunit SecF
MKTNIQISIYLTWSKIMAFMILTLAFIMDMYSDKKGTVFMFSIPFVVGLVIGKQFYDRGKEKDAENK